MRPTLYTKELGDQICAQITEGISLATICKADEMPCPATIYCWLRTHKEFLDNYEAAKDAQADYFVEQTLTIPDTEEDVQRARLKVDVRKWAASKYKPKKYGDKMHLAGDEKNPVAYEDVTVKSKILSMLTEEQLRQIEANANT